jgi:checkpoint serine/threonine-protein kinase
MTDNSIVNFDLIEKHKENIEPLKEGRSVLALKEVFSANHDQLKAKQLEERSQIEQQLKLIDELDDPLQPYLDYIQWITKNFPSGVTVESGLVQVLERCTSEFRDVSYYKDDPRYLKVWLSYAKYSENPRDIFIYLARKEIGKSLATYYEEYANFLESNDRNLQATHVYQEGLKQNARPYNRLEKRYQEFEKRLQHKNLDNEPQSPVFPTRSALAVKSGGGSSLFSVHEEISRPQKRKLEIFTEEDDNELNDLKTGGWNELGTSKFRNKENKLEAKPWAGEVIKPNGFKKPLLNKVTVFQDGASSSQGHGPVYKIIETPGKKPEKIDMNFDLLYREDGEYCIQEVYATMIKNRQNRKKKGGVHQHQDPQLPLGERQNSLSPQFKSLLVPRIEAPDSIIFNDQPVHKTNDNVTIQLNIQKLKQKPSPTATFFTKEAKDEIYSMFNQKPKSSERQQNNNNNNNDDEEYDDQLIYDDQTEQFTQLTKQNLNDLTEKVDGLDIEKIPSDSLLSIISEYTVNPADESLQQLLLNDLKIPIASYSGFYQYPNEMTMISHLKKCLNLKQKNHVFIEFKANGNTFNLKSLLGEGGYACVYLAEGMSGKFSAIKAQKPSSPWEFYILRQIETRLKGSLTLKSIIKADEVHVYQDESYLILDYLKQGTVLDIVNLYKSIGRKVDEVLAIFITVELLKAIEDLHSVGILHGDLKPDNCMLRFFDRDDPNSVNDWRSRGIKLIDFGRSIDMRLFPTNIQFKSNWKTDNQDCPEMRNNSTWTYQVDYFGAASIIHTLLFGDFIETEFDGSKYVLKNSLKRYWKQDLWIPLFELLMNSAGFGKLPITNEIVQHRKNLEKWLSSNDSNLLSIIRDIETGLR